MLSASSALHLKNNATDVLSDIILMNLISSRFNYLIKSISWVKSTMRNISAKKSLDTLQIRLSCIEPDILNITLSGELDAIVYKDVLEFTEDNLFSDQKAVILDAKDLMYMDSSGIKYLSFLVSRFGPDNVALFGANRDLKRLVLIVGFDNRLTFLDDESELQGWRPQEKRAS